VPKMRPMTRRHLSIATRLRVLAPILGLLILGSIDSSDVSAISNTGCQGDIALVRVRGSGDTRAVDANLNRVGQVGNSGFQLTLDAVSKAFRHRAAQAGTMVNEYDLNYPALSTGVIKSDVTAGRLFNSAYMASVATGRDNLRTLLNVKKICTNQRLVLIGYSQGALVIGDVVAALSSADKARIAGLALFGDPRFDPADSAAQGSYEVTRYGFAALILGKRQTGPGFSNRARNYCYSEDLVCQGLNLYQSIGVQTNAHARGYGCNGLPSDVACRTYVDTGGASMARSAGLSLADLLGLQAPPPPPPPTCPAGQIGTPPNCTTPPPPPPTTWVEKVWWTSAGAFSAGPGAGIVSTIQPTGTLVTVDCRAYNLAVATSNTGGWWYHLVSPFAGQWTPASLYWNDPTGTALWDPAVRVC